MDNLTHTLFALTLARTPLGRAGRGTATALVLASNAPDIDVVMAARGNASYLQWHRGPTHGLLGVVVLGTIVALLVRAGQRIVDRRGPRPPDDPEAPFRMLLAASLIGVFGHILMDLPTSYGTRVLSPLDWHWFAVDVMPIVDVYLIVILVAGLLFGSASAAARRRNAAIVFVLMAANYGIRGVAHAQALALAPRVFGPTWPQRCDGSARGDEGLLSVWPHQAARASTTSNRCLVEVAAMPTFFSPFRWRLIAQMSNAYELHDVDVLDEQFRRPAAPAGTPWRLGLLYPNQWTPQVREAAAAPIAHVFLGFSRFPAARGFTDHNTGQTIARWTDMRFAAGLTLDQRVGRSSLFTATVRLDRDGHVIQQKLGE